MMQPTPAPTSPAHSSRPQDELSVLNPPPQNINSVPFSVLVGLFVKLQTEKKPERRRQYLNSWFNHWREENGYDLYPVLRLILPQKDRERAVYGLKETNIAKTYIKLIPLGVRDPDAIALMHWKKPVDRPADGSRGASTSTGDFPTVLYEVVEKRSSVIEGSLSVDDLNDILDELSKSGGKGEAQSKIMQKVYNRATAEEQRWIVRIILKDLIISVKESTVFSVFHPDAQDLFNTCSDLKKVAWELWDPSRRLNTEDKQIQLFRVFAPMLCKRPTKKIEDSVKEMGGGEFIIEEKLDGERMQLHKRGNEYFYCSRKGKDYTYLYGAHVGTGRLTPFIDAAFDSRIENAILDGEMLVWDPVSERNLPFGTLKTAALDKSNKPQNPQPCFKVFDLLYLNDMCLLDRSVAFRKRNMREYIKEVRGRIEFTAEFKGNSAKDVRQRMDEVMADRGEGLVMKAPKSQYVLNGRTNDWIKVKPEYMDNMGETVDVLVVAGNYGSGRRGGGVSTLVCAVFDDENPDQDEAKYRSFVRIGTGLSFQDYVWLRAKPWKTWDPKSPPSFLLTSNKGTDDKGDVYLDPEDSFMIKVKAAEITKSDQYHMKWTMRFPRALGIRDDLTVADCLTATGINEAVVSTKKRKMESEAAVGQKKRKKVVKKPELMGPKGPKASDIDVQSDLFDGMHFVVLADPKSRTGADDRKALISSIIANGGKTWTVVKDIDNLYVVYGGTTKFPEINRIVQKGTIDILRPHWIDECIRTQTLIPFQIKYFFHATQGKMNAPEFSEDAEDLIDAGDYEVDTKIPLVIKDEAADEKAGDVKIDPALADWFKVEQEDIPKFVENSDTETEDDSDHDDLPPDGDDEWLDVSPEEAKSSLDMKVEKDEDVKMGETDNAMDYDENAIFKHLCFYLDTPENARYHDMAAKSKHEDTIAKNFAEISKAITENGGRIVDLDEPKLTHVVIDRLDATRRLKLIERTSQPKRRRLVIMEWLRDSLDEGTLLDEEDYVP
ncbi:ATP-dependent DNA ligase [Athelia psychrophila]|uniref:DNA ligase n=1 Tax=Athelia psychrophila TaxID=1759441 RepID=A0A166FAG6_9AGAM|nr:ATP-dependent DNA ligase [Fibularhizoctonia sp. CBS 109695]